MGFMSAPLMKILEKLLKLHKSLYQIAVEKTEVIKKGDLDALQTLLKNEQSHISAIQMVEKERGKMIAEMLPDHLNPTLNDCIPFFESDEKAKVMTLQGELVDLLTELKSVNELNQQLLEQSLQFVSLNIDLLLPNNPTNYSKEEVEEGPELHLFDSKA